MFAYCNNNPVNGWDPSGRKFVSTEDFFLEDEDGDEEGVIKYNVPLYNQGGTNLCWAFCQVMMESYRTGVTLSRREAKKKAIGISQKINGRRRKDWNVSGWPSDSVGPYQAETIHELYNLLRDHGPLYVNYQRDGGGHCVIVTGVDVNRDIVYTNNPWGIKGQQSFEEFKTGVVRRFFDPNHEYKIFGLYYSE